jgi:tripartite-type tricarboxylate transporter receptor subunit TctC
MIHKFGKPIAVLGATAAMSACLAATATAQDPAAFYKGRNIDVIVASPPGGGFDAYARTITRTMVKYMPGPPVFVIKNMPGAGGKHAAAYMATVGAKDGTVILASQPGALVEQILGDPTKVLYDPLKFQYIGSAESFTSLCLIRTDSDVKSYKELHEKEAVFGGDQIGSTTHDHALMFKNLSNAKIKLVTGYKGTANLVLAIKRKEIDGFCGYAWSSLFARGADLIENKIVKIVNQLGLKPHAEATKAGVPMALDFVKDPDNRNAMELIATVQEFGRPYVVHGDVPKDRVAVLRKAFDQTMADKDYIAAIKKAKLDVSPRTGQEVAELLRKVIEAPKAVQDKARWAISHR